MDVGALFLHNAAHERDRVEYRGNWSDDERAQIEAALDVLVDDPDFVWRHGKPRAPRKVDGGFNHFIVIKWSNNTYGLKRFTWDNFKNFTSIDEVVSFIDYLYRPLSQRG